MTWVDDDHGFYRELLRGRRTELAVALRLLDEGFGVRAGALRFRESFADRGEFADEVDLEVEGGHRLEVKGRNLVFSGSEDYPFDTVFVCARKRWERRRTKPCAIVVVSEPTSGMVVVPGSSADRWVTETVFDKLRECEEEKLACPREHVFGFGDLVSHLRVRHDW